MVTDAVLYCPIPFLSKAYTTEILITSALESIGGWQFSAEFLSRVSGFIFSEWLGKEGPHIQ